MIMIDILGWMGSAMIVTAYALNIAKKISTDSTIYFALNIIGSALLIINTIYHNAIPSAAVNIVWIVIAIFALFKKQRKSSS